MTRREKDVIRSMPCGRCGARPPFADGTRCQPHRLVPGSAGGKYVVGNVEPRCASCHDIEHGGTGAAPLIGAASDGGRKGGRASGESKRRNGLTPAALAHARSALDVARASISREQHSANSRKGAHRTHELHPDLAREVGRRVGRRYGRAGARRMHELHPEQARQNGLKSRASLVARTAVRSAPERRASCLKGWVTRRTAQGGA